MATRNTIKGKEVIAYKYMNTNMCCSGDFKFEIGKTYKTDKVKINECGFHACLNPQDTFIFYSQGENSRYFKVLLSGEIAKCGMWDTNVAATEITILEEIAASEIINIAEWWKHENVLDLLYFSDGLAQIINCERQYNFIGKDGKLLSDKWFEFADIFRDGLALIQREDGLQNYIDAKGNILSNDWFEWLDYFKGEFARVKRANGEYNYIDTKGKILSSEWFRYADYFDNDNGLAEVYRTNGEQCKIDKNGKIVVRK